MADMSNTNDLAYEIAEMRRASRRQNLRDTARLAVRMGAGAAGGLVELFLKNEVLAVALAIAATAAVVRLQRGS